MEGKERIPFHEDTAKAQHPHPPILEIIKGLDISKFFSNWNFSLVTFSLKKGWGDAKGKDSKKGNNL